MSLILTRPPPLLMRRRGTHDSLFGSVTALLPFDNNVTDYSSSALTYTPTSISYATFASIGSTPGSGFSTSLHAALFGNSSQVAPGSPGLTGVFPGDFDIGVFIYPTSFSGYFSIYSTSITYTNGTGFLITLVPTTGCLAFYSSGAALFTSSTGATLNAWNFVQVTRSGSTISFYLNNVLLGTLTNSTNFSDGIVVIGASTVWGTGITGYMSELRVTKAARANAQPSSPFPTS